MQSTKKGSSSISEYLQCIKEAINALAATSAPVDDHDLLFIILNGLPNEYDSFVDFIQYRLADTIVDDLFRFLLSKELALACKKQTQGTNSTTLPLLPTPQAYIAQPPHFSNFNRSNFQRNNSQPNYNNRNQYNRTNKNSFNHEGNLQVIFGVESHICPKG